MGVGLRDPHRRRELLLRAAVDVFARDGFVAASLRDISARAGVNLAATKYFFGDKAGLYQAAVEFAASTIMAENPPPDVSRLRDPRDAVRTWAVFFVAVSVRGGASRAALTKILLRELREPTPMLDRLVQTQAVPMVRALRETLHAAAPHLSPQEIRDATTCMLAMGMQYEHSGELLQRLGNPPPRTDAQIARVGAMIADMVLGAIDARARARTPAARRRPAR